MENRNDFLSVDCMSDASRTVIRKKSAGQRIRYFWHDHKTTIVLSGCVVLLAALLYKAKKYAELDIKQSELLKKYTNLETEQTEFVKELLRFLDEMNKNMKIL